MVLLEVSNWQGSRTAILESENNCIYLYSYPSEPDRPMKTLWVANTKRLFFKKTDIKKDMDAGLQPYMPIKNCTNSGVVTDFSDKGLWDIQWGLDQNSIALRYKGAIIAIIPEWSGHEGFWGYSSGTANETAISWPLVESNSLIGKFNAEKEVLDHWREDLWVKYQEELSSIYVDCFPSNERYFAADEGNWPELGIHCSSGERGLLVGTIGLAQLPMPTWGMQRKDDEIPDYSRIEFAMVLDGDHSVEVIAGYLSGQAGYPWYWGAHFDEGYTLPSAELEQLGSKMSHVLFVGNAEFLPEIKTSKFSDNKTRILFMVPIFAEEQRFAEEQSSRELLRLLADTRDPLNIDRSSVV